MDWCACVTVHLMFKFISFQHSSSFSPNSFIPSAHLVATFSHSPVLSAIVSNLNFFFFFRSISLFLLVSLEFSCGRRLLLLFRTAQQFMKWIGNKRSHRDYSLCAIFFLVRAVIVIVVSRSLSIRPLTHLLHHFLNTEFTE